MSLNPRQKAFAVYYSKTSNSTLSAKKAGYSENTAYQIGSELLKNVEIQKEVQKHIDIKAKRVSITAEKIVVEIAKIAFMDIADAYDKNGDLKNIKDIPENVRAAIIAVETEELFDGKYMNKEKIGKTRRVRFESKIKALELLSKIFNMIGEQNHTQSIDDETSEKVPAITKEMALKLLEDKVKNKDVQA